MTENEKGVVVYVNVYMLGTMATQADVDMMVEMLKSYGYDARSGNYDNRLTEEQQKQLDIDFQLCLEEMK